MKNPRKIWIPVFLFVGMAALLVVTRRDLEEPNLRIFVEMSDSPAYQSQTANPVLPGGVTAQPPVPGTIPRGFQPFAYEASDAGRRKAARELANPLSPSLENLASGRDLYLNYCGHCHGDSGRGDGAVAKAFSGFAMAINGKVTQDLPDGEVYHIITYGRNNMPGHSWMISQEDRWRIVLYLRDMQTREAQRLADLGFVYEEDPRIHSLVSADYGKELYDTNCGSCHGAEGKNPERGVPTLNLPRVLGFADDEYYMNIITHGRKGTQMPAWEEILTPTQIQSLARYIRSWTPDELDPTKVARTRGNVERGRSLFRGNCAPCHGGNGEGGLGMALNPPSFLALATDTFLRETIVKGRKHTAMPAWSVFDEEEVSDLIAYMRSWAEPKNSWAEVEAALAEGGNKRIGKKIYRARCASCHDKKGEGGIGSRLNSQSFLSMADDKFLYRSIAEGRPGTAMPAWFFLESRDIADVITYIRDWQKVPSRKLNQSPREGRPEFGEILYNQGCASCHGPEGHGGVGGQIGNPTYLSMVSDEFLWRSIAYGKDDTAMRGFLKGAPGGSLMPMTGREINHIVAYLRELQLSPPIGPMKRPHPVPDKILGKEIYEKKGGCANCHGFFGEGASGPAVGNPSFLEVASDGYLAGTIILGRENTEMLSFYRGGNVKLTQEEVEAVTAYIRSFENLEEEHLRKSDLSPSSILAGKDLYLKHCGSCHGTEGMGPKGNDIFDGYAPSLNNQEFLHAADDNFLIATIALGRPGTPMRSFAKGSGGISDLTPEEIRMIISYIRSWEEPELEDEDE